MFSKLHIIGIYEIPIFNNRMYIYIYSRNITKLWALQNASEPQQRKMEPTGGSQNFCRCGSIEHGADQTQKADAVGRCGVGTIEDLGPTKVVRLYSIWCWFWSKEYMLVNLILYVSSAHPRTVQQPIIVCPKRIIKPQASSPEFKTNSKKGILKKTG